MNRLNNTTQVPNPMNSSIHSNNNNLDQSTGMIHPIIRIMNQGQNLDDMLNEMSKVLLNLQSDMSKVMTGINQLNLLISNIQKYRANNSMNNNMMGNDMNNNMMNSNNMMNNNINNMMNNFNNMNNLINNNINNINPMMSNINMNMNQYQNIPKIINVFFRETGNDSNKIPIMINVKEDEKIQDIIQKYREKSSNYDINLKFIFNAKELNLSLTVAEAGITNNANIFVVKKRI